MLTVTLMKKQPPIPPTSPWIPINPNSTGEAVIAWHYSDSNTKIPIRDVSHPTDPKADPNIETRTYGLFTTCNKVMRKSVVRNGITTIFFCTSRKKNIRVLTGYYQLGWYYEVEPGDYMLAARELRFVNPGYLLDDLVEYLEAYPINRRFRTWKTIRDSNVATKMLELLKATPDNTLEYLKEIIRLTPSSFLPIYTWSLARRPMRIGG